VGSSSVGENLVADQAETDPRGRLCLVKIVGGNRLLHVPPQLFLVVGLRENRLRQALCHKTAITFLTDFEQDFVHTGSLLHRTDADAVWSAPGTSGGITLNNPRCLKWEYARASYSVGQRFVANFDYDLPFARASSLPKRLTQGWKLLGIFSAQSGFPFTVVGPYGTLRYGYDIYDGVGARPFLQKATRSPSLKAPTGPQYFSNAVIADAATITSGATGTFFGVPQTTSPNLGGATVQTVPGNLGRNTFTGPGWSNLDFSVIKDTRITESKTLQLRAEFFNVLNQATFGTPTSSIGNPTFGLITGTATIERQIQFGLRFVF
jgi:hypothetical protein